MRLVLVTGTTRTATIDGISAAGASPDLVAHTPSADAEIVVYGEPVASPVTPVSPTGCPTPAAVTRAVVERLDLPVTVVDAGLAEPTAAPTVTVDASPGGDLRSAAAVPDAADVFEAGLTYGRALPTDDPILLGESVPGGTTTALGVLTALGERATVSSSLPDNPLERKRAVVAEGLDASGLTAGGAAGAPTAAVRAMGDPVLAAGAGIARGALETGTPLTLAGGTQLLALAALLRHDGVESPLSLATTSFLLDDESAAVAALADSLDVAVRATDPGFDAVDHPATDAYCAGEAKEGVGMGGALSLVADADADMASVRERFVAIADRLDPSQPADDPAVTR